jgi:ABC-type amino acid transport substrate-binding protein
MRWLILIILTFSASAAAFQSPSGVKSEAIPRTVRVGLTAGGWPPFEYAQGDNISGFSRDLLVHLIGDPSVVLVPIIYPDWPALQQGLCHREIDLVLSATDSPQRRSCMTFGRAYYTAVPVMVVRRSRGLDTADLSKLRLATPRGYYLSSWVAAQGITHLDVNSPAEALQAVQDGQADGFIESPLVAAYLLQGGRYPGLYVPGPTHSPAVPVSFAAPSGPSLLIEELDRRLEALSAADMAKLEEPWLGKDGPSAYQLKLTADEVEWVRSLPPLQVAWDPESAPFSFTDERGQPTGSRPVSMTSQWASPAMSQVHETS